MKTITIRTYPATPPPFSLLQVYENAYRQKTIVVKIVGGTVTIRPYKDLKWKIATIIRLQWIKLMIKFKMY